MSTPQARRVRNRFLTVGLLVSAVTFAVIEGDALVDQSQIGHASALFMFGTACLAAAACVVLFAIITAIGLAVSAAFSDEPPQQQSDRIQDAAVTPSVHTDPSPGVAPALGRLALGGGNGSVLLRDWRRFLRNQRRA